MYMAFREVVGQIPLEKDLAGAGLKYELFPGKLLLQELPVAGSRATCSPSAWEGRGDEGQWLFSEVSKSCTSMEIMKLSREDLGRERLMLKLL